MYVYMWYAGCFPRVPVLVNPCDLCVIDVIDATILVSSAKEYCKVMFAFEATNEDELSLKEGDIIHILSKVSFQSFLH